MEDPLRLFDLVDDPAFRQHVSETVARTLTGLNSDLAAMPADGAQMAYTIRVVHRPSGESKTLVFAEVVGIVESTRATDEYLKHLANQQCMMSVRLPLSSRLVIVTGQAKENESAHMGSATMPIDVDATYALSVGCAGPHELLCEAYANRLCADVALLFVRRVLRDETEDVTDVDADMVAA